MAYAERHRLTLTTDSNGDVTGHTPIVTGKIVAITYTKTDYAAGVDVAVTAEATGQNIWTELNVDATATVAPRQATHDEAGVASLYAATFPVEDGIVVANDRVEVVISNGGDTKVGQFDIIIGG